MQTQAVVDVGWTDAEATCLMRSRLGGQHGLRSAGLARRRQTTLTAAVENEVIPRLLAARCAQTIPKAETPLGQEQISRLVALVLGASQAAPAAYVETLRQTGAPTESLLLDLLTPAARRLGEMWDDDICTFTDVTAGMLRLGHVMRLLDDATPDRTPKTSAPSALLVQMPGEQHGFGLAMLVQFFRNAAWNVRQAPAVTSTGLTELARAQGFSLIGISVSCCASLERLETDIRAIRRHSRNRAVRIMVGGPPFLAHPQLAAMVGADATAADGREAVRLARRLVSGQ